MRETWKKWFPSVSKIVLRELLLLLCAVAMGLGWGVYQSPKYLPTMSGNVYAMDPTGDSLFMVLSKESNNSLVHVDYRGNLLHYAVTETNQAFENLVVLDDTIYAVLTTYDTGSSTQELVSLSMEHTSMHANVLLDLSTVEGAVDITWSGAYLPLDEKPKELCLGGIDDAGNGYLLHWDLNSEHSRLEPILDGEKIYKLKYVDDNHYVWIDAEGQLCQSVNGRLWRNLFASTDDSTPYHISTCANQVLVSDSLSGNIYEITSEGTAHVAWYGTETIQNTDYQYEDIAIYTTYLDDDNQIQVIALCHDGDSNVVIGPDGIIKELHMGSNTVYMVIGYSLPFMLFCFVLLTVLAEVLRAAFRSPRMAVRLAMCELIMAGVMLGAVLGIQYSFYQDTIQEDAQQKLQLLGGNLADVLSADGVMKNEEVGQLATEVLQRTQNSHQYTVNVIWLNRKALPIIGYDNTIPVNYAVEDVKSRDYDTTIRSFLTHGKENELREIRNALNVKDFIYIQRITQTNANTQEYWVGCVTVSQSERDILAGRTSFWLQMAPVLIACPFLFALLIFITWRLLHPLGIVRESLEEFYDTGGGNQMELTHIPKTELYQVGLVFNELSHQTKVQLNALHHINGAYARLVPDCLCQMLHKVDILSLVPGDYRIVDGALLILVPETPARTAKDLERLFAPAAERIVMQGGMIMDYDEGLGAVTALFSNARCAEVCAQETIFNYQDTHTGRVMVTMIQDSVELGVFGSDHHLYPVAVSGSLHRRQEVLSLMLEFGAVLVFSKPVEQPNLRLLGWDGEANYYEDPAFRPSSWRSQWVKASSIWNEAITLFRQQQFAQSMRRFAQFLRLLPEDNAARWYLFRCESLRDMDHTKPLDTGLLFHWRDQYG